MAVWEEVNPGELQLGDEVRVSHAAYSSYDVGRLHNGRLCRVIGLQNGDVVVETIDGRHPPLKKVHHPAYKLERKAQQ